jgi:hypothetical protein
MLISEQHDGAVTLALDQGLWSQKGSLEAGHPTFCSSILTSSVTFPFPGLLGCIYPLTLNSSGIKSKVLISRFSPLHESFSFYKRRTNYLLWTTLWVWSNTICYRLIHSILLVIFNPFYSLMYFESSKEVKSRRLDIAKWLVRTCL